MSQFVKREEGWACWPEESPQEVIRVDIPNPSKPVFLATNHERNLRMRFIDDLGTDAQAEVARQGHLLEHFLDAPAPELMFVVVLGKSGTGKSHLVKWVQGEIERRDNRSDHVVYISKTDMSLRRVVELTIQRMSGPEIDRVRQDLERVKKQVPPEIAASQLAQYLSLAVEEEEFKTDDDQEKEFLGQVHDLIRDPVFSDFLADQEDFETYARELAGGARAGSDRSFTFAPTRLPPQAALRDASLISREAAQRLLGNKTEVDRLCEALNRCLHGAVRRMIGLGDTNLLQLFSEVRRVLSTDSKRLLLLIEDLTVLSGIENEFADAITVPSTDTDQLCELRVLAASTDESYFGSPFWTKETVRTRSATSGRAYVLDEEWERFGNEALERFLGRYLNAVRIGKDELSGAFKEQSGVEGWVPNACSDCELQEECHRIFGSTVDGFGLFPFTSQALLHARDLIGAEFDPRKLLSGTRETLQHRMDLIRGLFPPGELDGYFRKHEIRAGSGLSAAERKRIEDFAQHEKDRYLRFFEFWGGGEVSSESEPEASAFGLAIDPILEGDTNTSSISDTSAEESTTKTDVTPSETPRTKDLEDLLDVIEKWGRGRQLQSTEAGLVREAVFEHVKSELSTRDSVNLLSSLGWVERKNGSVFSLSSVDLGRAEGGGGAVGSWTLRIDPDDVDDILFVLGLLQYDALGHWHFEDGHSAYRRCRSRLDKWATELERAIHGEPSMVADIAALLAAGGGLLGLADLGSRDNSTVLAAAFASTPELIERSDEWGNPLQRELVDGPRRNSWDRTRLLDELLGRFGVRQGTTGEFRSIDSVAVLEALSGFPEGRLPTPDQNAHEGLLSYWRPVPDRVDELLDIERSKVLREWRAYSQDIKRAVDMDEPLDEVLSAVSELVEVAEEAGILGGVKNARDWRERLDTVGEVVPVILGAIELLDAFEELSFWEKVAFLSVDRGTNLEATSEIARLVSSIEASTRENLEYQRKRIRQDTSLGSSLNSLAQRVQSVIERVSPEQ